jgi:bifunctional DNA-binding transcriptional regulator/antitoxin component of YhaV-PrlF toxin-antitoxin module
MVMVEVEITSVDKAGRIVLPKGMREKLGINERILEFKATSKAAFSAVEGVIFLIPIGDENPHL